MSTAWVTAPHVKNWTRSCSRSAWLGAAPGGAPAEVPAADVGVGFGVMVRALEFEAGRSGFRHLGTGS
jgi:hypothetical protein